MPCLELSTNVRVPDQTQLMRALSHAACTALGKAETYMMVIVRDQLPMYFSGTTEPVAQLTLRALNLKPEAIASLARTLTETMQAQLGIESQRVSIVFMEADMNKWAWDGRTFA